MRTLRVEASNGSYDIRIGAGAAQGWRPKGEYAVITDRNVYEAHGDTFPKDAYALVLEPGEQTKCFAQLERILDTLAHKGLDRSAALVAFGGGVVGDITGLAAALYKRGIRYIQVPTTLLAQVDSSVGGKVAVDLPAGKNLAGVFLQPEFVVADTSMLKTLPEREFAAGMAEVIKYAYIADADLYERLANEDIGLDDLVERCCAIKADYVERDPYDTGVRAQLNYGHTIGHAIESAAGYGTYLHGEAVAIGMVYAAVIGEALGISPKGLADGTRDLLKKYNLPTDVPKDVLQKAAVYLGRDKKVSNGKISFVLIDRIGHAVQHEMTPEAVQKIVLGEEE